MTEDKRFPASINCRHRALLTQVMAGVPVGGGAVVISPEQDSALRDLAGALNYWATQPGGCDSPQYPVAIQPTIAIGDYGRKLYTGATDVVVAFPFTMPAAGLLHMAASEFSGQPWARLLTVSTIAGDLDSPHRSAGKVPDLYLTAGVEYPAGTPLFANNILTEQPTVPNSSGSGFSIVWPA